MVESLLQVPETAHGAVRFTTLLLLGELGEWMDKHPAVVGTSFLFVLYQHLITNSIMVFRTCTSLLATIHQRSVVGCCSFEFAGSSNQRMSRSRHVSFRHFAPSSKRSGYFAHPDRHGCSGCQRSHQSMQSAA